MRIVPLLSLPALVLVILVLAACSPSPETPEAPPIDVSPATLAGVDLSRPIRALGNEPFWAVEIKPEGLVYSGVDRPEQRADNPGPLLQGTTARYEATTGTGKPLTVALIATTCSDGMSDRTYPLTAVVKVDGETLTGCAASISALATAGESGLVVDKD
ncbi:hypothetical protein [uncultured Brevundimonas sp.]|uniref:COG3650 family protein n=1 Tax=uncultured Brevundimonas sp. TaxID=213418 RepID=UPI0030ED3A52|tara:strand:- start:61984 stop:62460 length:477 start_codon:yes stop_codon:yes gene_type:complete